MIHEAIRNLYPNVVVIQDDIGCFDHLGKIVEIDLNAVEIESKRLLDQAKLLEYRRQRVTEYPPLQDLADALYWQSKGDNSKMEAYVAACEAVKEKYPKGV